MEMRMEVLLPYFLLCMHELLWAPWPPTWNYNLFLTEEQWKHHHHFPRSLMAITLVLSDKQTCIHNFSLCVSIFSARKHVSEVDAGLKALTTFNLISNAVFLFKFYEMETNPHLSSVNNSEVEQIKSNKDYFNSEQHCLLTVLKEYC